MLDLATPNDFLRGTSSGSTMMKIIAEVDLSVATPMLVSNGFSAILSGNLIHGATNITEHIRFSVDFQLIRSETLIMATRSFILVREKSILSALAGASSLKIASRPFDTKNIRLLSYTQAGISLGSSCYMYTWILESYRSPATHALSVGRMLLHKLLPKIR